MFLSRATRPTSHRVCRSVGRSVGPNFIFGKQTAFTAQLITAPAQLPATGVAVYTALLINLKM